MADSLETPQVDAPTMAEERAEPLKFTLQVVSPSVGVSSPLSFPHLLATTTVKELKAKIRDVLPSKPLDESQRLIHRGRMLGREAETMLDIFGLEILANSELQTLHLVLRPTALEASSQSSSTTHTPIPQTHTHHLPPPPQFQPRPQSTPVNPIQALHGMHAQQPLPGFQHPPQHLPQHGQTSQIDHLQASMIQRLAHLQRETQRLHQEMAIIEQRARAQAGQASPIGQQTPNGPGIPPQSIFQRAVGPPPPFPPSFNHLINQQQRERAAEGRQGAQDITNLPHPPGTQIFQIPRTGTQTASGRSSPNIHRPDHTSSYTREGVGPNGERWSVTVNETTTTFPIPQEHAHNNHHPAPHTNPALDIQAVLRNADRYLAQNGQVHLQRNASNPTPSHTSSASALGATDPETPGTVATPATTGSSPSASTFFNPPMNANPPVASQATTVVSTSNSHSNQPMVYLLSSPAGPRALLVTNSETYFTPRQSSRRRHSPIAQVQGQGQGQAPAGPAVLPEYRNRLVQRARRNRAAAAAVPHAPHANPAAAPLGAQMGALLWLIVRLIGFVWFFTSGNPSWTRWFMVVGLGIVVFLINTGIMNGLVNDLFGPIRRHVENLIPLAGPEAALVPAANAAIPQPAREARAGGLTPQQRRRGELDPAEAAARILEQQRQARQNGGWLFNQIRRAEHSLLLFLASLVPGVGERHIAAREAEANAAEARRAEAAAAAEAAEAAATVENAENADIPPAGGVNGSEGTSEHKENDSNGAQANEGAPAPAQPLIEV